MASVKIKLDRAGMQAALKSAGAQAALADVARGLAARVHPTADGDPVKVSTASHMTPITAASSVTIEHPAGVALEARHGYLKGAARSAGLKVTERA